MDLTPADTDFSYGLWGQMLKIFRHDVRLPLGPLLWWQNGGYKKGKIMEIGKTRGLSCSPGQGQWGYMGRDDGVEPNSQQSISLVTSASGVKEKKDPSQPI